MLKNIIRLIVVVAIAIAAIFLWEQGKNFNLFGIKDVQTTHNIVLKEMTTLGKLELAKFTFRDVVEQQLVRDFLPDPKALLIVQGEAIGCIDLTKVGDKDITIENDTVYVKLPKPELCSHKIDHSKSKIFQTEYAFMNEDLLLDEAYRRAEKQIYQSALDSGILEQTQKNAELVLKPLFENLTGKKVVLKY